VKKKLAACALIAAWTVVSFGADIEILEIEKSRTSFQGQHHQSAYSGEGRIRRMKRRDLYAIRHRKPFREGNFFRLSLRVEILTPTDEFSNLAPNPHRVGHPHG
jgi:hypothetical protein